MANLWGAPVICWKFASFSPFSHKNFQAGTKDDSQREAESDDFPSQAHLRPATSCDSKM